MSIEGESSGFSGAGEGSATAVEGASASQSFGISTEFSVPSGISELSISPESAAIIDSQIGVGGFDNPSFNNLSNLSENPFSLPEHSIDIERISMDTTRILPELAFSRDLYPESITFDPKTIADEENTLPQELALPTEEIAETATTQVHTTSAILADHESTAIITPAQVIFAERVSPHFAPKPEQEIEGQLAQVQKIPEADLDLQGEVRADATTLQKALESLAGMGFSPEQEHQWKEMLENAAADPMAGTEPLPSLAYQTIFGKAEIDPKSRASTILSSAQKDAVGVEGESITAAAIETEPEAQAETGLIELTETEEEVEITDQNAKKKVVKIPEDSWDRYEITERDQTADDVQKGRKELAQEAVYSATNTDGVIDAGLLGGKLSQLDNQTPDEKLRIAEGTLQVPDASDQAKAGIAGTQTPDQALSTVIKVIAQNEARDHTYEITSHQTLPFDKLDRGAQEVIANLQTENVIRPLVWEPADKLPLRNPVEIGRHKKAA